MLRDASNIGLVTIDGDEAKKQFIKEVIVNKIDYWDKEVYKDEKCREAMESLGFSILSHLDGESSSETQYCIAPYSVLWTGSGDNEEAHIIPHNVNCNRLPEAVRFINDNNICGYLHELYYPILKGDE